MGNRPSFLPEVRQFSQADERVIERPEGLDGGGAGGVEASDVRKGRITKYADMQATPGKYFEAWPFTAQPMKFGGGEVILYESDLGFMCHAWAIDNWTNQWIYDGSAKRFIPPYSGPWIVPCPRGFQTARLFLKAPPAYAPAAAIGGEFIYSGWHEAYLSAMNGISILVKTPVVA